MAMIQGRAGHWWVENLLRPMVIAAMMTCLAVPVVWGLEWVAEGWSGTYLLVFFFFAGLEGILSERTLRRKRIGGYGYLSSRAAELVILLVLLKLVSYIPMGLGQFGADLQEWERIDQWITTVDLLAGLLFVPLWSGAIYVARQAMELDVDEVRAAPPLDKTSTEYYLWLTQPPLAREREQALQWLGETFMWGGVMMLAASAVIFGVLPTVKVPATPTLLYFALGVALLSQARFSVTNIGWQVQGIEVQPGIARRWFLWAVVFLVGMALIARGLPTEYALGPVLAIYYVLSFIVQGVMLLVTLILYAMALLISLFIPDVAPPEAPSLTLPEPPSAGPTTETHSWPWLEVLLSALFWVVILGILGYAVFRFLRDRWGLLDGIRRADGTWWGRLLAWFRAWWRRGWAGWRQARASLARHRVGPGRGEPIGAFLGRLFSLRRLAPRDLVRYFYLSAVRRAEQAGQARRPGQTPYEYQADLRERFSDLEPDLGDLTEGFVKARYSQHAVEREDAEAVKGPWQRIKAALRQRRVVRR
jgi:hypothetical protein